MSDCRVAVSSFSASLHGSPPRWPRNCTHQLSTPVPCGRGGRTCRARGVAPRQECLMPFDDLLGDRRAALAGK